MAHFNSVENHCIKGHTTTKEGLTNHKLCRFIGHRVPYISEMHCGVAMFAHESQRFSTFWQKERSIVWEGFEAVVVIARPPV